MSKRLFIEELEEVPSSSPLFAAGAGTDAVATTLAVGEECGPVYTTLAIGEESGPIYTTMAIGEEGCWPKR